jgi:hypothetical protein
MKFSELQYDERSHLLFFIASRHVQDDQRIDFLYGKLLSPHGTKLRYVPQI